MKRWGGLVMLLLSVWLRCGEADVLEFAWEFPLDLRQGTSFIAQTVTTVNNQTVARDVPLTLIACGTAPGLVTTPETMCGQLCVGPGPYTLQAFAVQGNERSPLSNPVDVDAQVSCQPVVVLRPPPPPPPKQPVKEVPPVTIPPPPIPFPLPVVNPLLVWNQACVSWSITGVCACGFPPHSCLTVSYYEPAYLVETVKQPGASMLPGGAQLLGGALGTLTRLWGGGSPGPTTGEGGAGIHYNEVHVFNFPQLLGGPCTACLPRTIPLALRYASEIDAVSWRTAVAPVANPLTTALQIGVWARLYPRQGKVLTASEPVSSAVAGIRAIDIAQKPIGVPPNVDAHVVPLPIPGTDSLLSCIQMASPRMLPCIQAGTPPPVWENGAVDIRGNYLWIVWHKRSCCVEIDQTTCGITLPGVGLRGANFCPLTPVTP